MTRLALRVRILTLLCAGALVLVVWIPQLTSADPTPPQLRVHFLDVGQGDAIFIEVPNGRQVLIDGGRDRSVLRELGSIMGFFDRDIDMVIATHPDQDHIGGLVDVLERYEVASVLRSGKAHDSATAAAFSTAVAAENAAAHQPRAGAVIDLGASTTIRVLFPTSDIDVADLDSNESSLILQLQYGDTEFMLTGDAPDHIEEYLVDAYGDELESEVLKVGHHGSKTSTAEEFLAAVRSEYAIISAGADNSYGHPDEGVLARLRAADLKIRETATEGTISFMSDGEDVSEVD